MTHKNNGHTSAAMDQAVADCFGALLAAIDTSADAWRLRAAEALLDRDDARAQECFPAIERFAEASREVESLRDKWKDSWPALPVALAGERDVALHAKRPGSKLRVQVNSKALEYPDAAETFAHAIEEIGLDRLARLGKALSGIALVGTSKATGYQQQYAIGGFYVCTHSNTQTKKRLLEEIALELGAPIHVEIISEK